MFKAILFDLDQTLLDRNTSLKKFLEWQIKELDLVAPDQIPTFINRFLILDQQGSVWKDIVYQKLVDEFKIKQSSVNFLLESYIDTFQYFSRPFPFVKNAISTLNKEGYLLALISNGKMSFQENNFLALGLDSFFTRVIVSEAVHLRKPDPRIFLYAFKELRVQPKECIFVGDNPQADIEGANNVGMTTIYFNPNSKLKLKQANQTIHHFNQLIDSINLLTQK